MKKKTIMLAFHIFYAFTLRRSTRFSLHEIRNKLQDERAITSQLNDCMKLQTKHVSPSGFSLSVFSLIN